MSRITQTDSFNEEQLNQKVSDEYSDEIIEEEQDKESRDNIRRSMKSAESKFNIPSGWMVGIVIALVVIIVIVFVLKPFSNGDGEGFSFGKFFGREGSLGSDVTGDVNLSYSESLVQYLEGYEVTDNGDSTYTVTGENADGVNHIIVYDGNFNILTETVGDSLTEYVTDPNTGERVPQEALTSDNVSVNNASATVVEGEDMVKVDKWSFEHSTLGMPKTDLELAYDDNGRLLKNVYDDKLIIEFVKLPIRGHTSQVYAKVLETDIELIFDINIESYLQLEDKGVTVIRAKVTEIGGKKMYHDIKFDQWK